MELRTYTCVWVRILVVLTVLPRGSSRQISALFMLSTECPVTFHDLSAKMEVTTMESNSLGRCAALCLKDTNRLSQATTREYYRCVRTNMDAPAACAYDETRCYIFEKTEPCLTPVTNGGSACCVGYFGDTCDTYAEDCEDVRAAGYPSGEYVFRTEDGEGAVTVFCDFRDDHTITFISKYSLSDVSTQDPLRFYDSRKKVILRQSWTDGGQRDTVLKQLSRYGNIPLTISFDGTPGNFLSPTNNILGTFAYLGFLSRDVVKEDSKNGYRVKSFDQEFENCNDDANSYFAFFPNLENRNPPDERNYSGDVDMFAWSQTTKTVQVENKLPDEYFYVTEVHFGGCGGFTVSTKWSTVTGTSLGLVSE